MRELLPKIKINPLFWFIVGIGVITGYFREIIMIFLIVFIHEMGHACAAQFFNWRIHKIELLPFGGVAEVKDIDNRPFHEELIVILAGPLQHIWLIALSYLLLSFPFWSEADHRIFVLHNVMILGFNLLPILPLDGGRLIQLWFMYRYSYIDAHRYARNASIVTLCTVCILGAVMFSSHLNLWVVLIFLAVANYLEWKQRHFRFIRFLMTRQSQNTRALSHSMISVKDSIPLREAIKQCRRGYQHRFKIHRAKLGVSSIVEEEQLLDAFFIEKRPQAPLSTFIFSNRTPF